MKQIRVLELGDVAALRSQTIYHAVARSMTDTSPDTIILVAPEEPYVCIGFHQDLEAEVDTDYCAANGLQVVRREVGGGAVYLDRNQVFSQWVFHNSSLPVHLDDQFELYIRPIVETYQALGVDAYLRPVNDIHVGGKKIGGTGAAQIGPGRVLVGSLMFDFDKATMARVLQVPSEKMRDKIFESLEEYMTTLAELLPQAPDREAVSALYLERCAAVLDAELVHGHLTAEELAEAVRLDAEFVSDEWLNRKSPLRKRGVKIHEDVSVVSGMFKAPGGLIRAAATLVDGSIADVGFSGDFTILPSDGLNALEESLAGVERSPAALQDRLERTYARLGLETPGVLPEHFVAALQGAGAL